MTKPTYNDIEDIVEYLVRTKCRNYTFECFDKDDIAQEIRMLCLKALPKLDTARPRDKWVNFFGRSVDNGLKNLKRDRYVRASFPDKKRLEGLDSNDQSENAQKLRLKWQKHQENIKCKLAIKHPSSIDGLADLIRNGKLDNELIYNELEGYLLEKADEDIMEPLRLILSGKIGEVTKNEKRRVQAFVRKILDSLRIDHC